VDKDSARLNLPNEIAVGIAGANHRTICKFGDAKSQKYLLVIRALETMVGSGVSNIVGMSGQISQEQGTLELFEHQAVANFTCGLGGYK